MNSLQRFFAAIARVARSVDANRGATQAIAGAIALGLGFWGWHIHKPPTDFAGWFTNVFRTIQLITLQFPTNLESGIPWQLQIARLAVPLVAALATFHVLIGAITRPVRLALMPHARGHIIICGAAQLTCRALEILAERGRQIVVIGSEMSAGRRATLEALGMTVIDADPKEPTTFRSLNLKRAGALFLTADSDIDNLDLAMLAMAYLRDRPNSDPPLALALLIEDEELAREIDAALDQRARNSNVRYHRLCPDRDGLRLDLKRFAPVFLKEDKTQRSHIMVLGLQGAWPQVVMELITASQDHPETRPLLTMVLDDDERDTFDVWKADRGDLELVVEFSVLPSGSAALPTESAVGDWVGTHRPPQLVVVLRDDADAVSTVLALRRPGNELGLEQTPILARRSTEDRLFSAIQGGGAPIIPFGGLIRDETIERTLDRLGDDLAIALHAHYLDAASTLGTGSPEALKAWDALPENLRDANRAAADHADILFAAGSLARGDAPEGAVLEDLARIEHSRWIADRIDRGWRSGPERDNGKRLHPSMRPFDELPPADQEKDRNAVRVLAKLRAQLAAH